MENSPKTQVVERLKEAQNVLVTVSNNPSVDQLAAAIGFTLMMNKLGKHATAVFSGQIPSTLEFLKPADTLETNTDSLRDFIISLDKSKADKLRYKVEENVVKIFITPYRTSLSEQDLDFSQGDFNVDAVIALGVDEREHIDQAIVAHGRILHDATVIGVMAGQAPCDVGSINWQDTSASSLSEMLVSISEAFQSGLLDGQMATAFLTGIVAETDRFSNEKTSPKVMTMSAQLMAAGANQQLIATELKPVQEVETAVPSDLPVPSEEVAPVEQPEDNPDEGEISLHNVPAPEPQPVALPEEPVFEPIAEPEPENPQIHIDGEGRLQDASELAQAVSDVQLTSREANLNRGKVIEPLVPEPNNNPYLAEAPQMGGTLTAAGQPEAEEPSTDPLSTIPQSAFPLPDYTTKAPDPQPQPVNEPPVLLPVPPASQVDAVVPGVEGADFDFPKEVEDKPLGPDITANETLEQIEKSVEEYTGEEVHKPDVNDGIPNAEDARQAVIDAMTSAGYDQNRPEPLQALGSQPLSAPELHETTPLDQNAGTPPPIVPPPFPMPDDTGILPPPPQQ